VTHEARISIIQKELTDLKNLLFSYEEQWEKEKKLIAKLDALEPFSSSNEAAQDMTLDISSNNEKYRSQYQATMSELLKIQGESPMILPLVNSRLISEVISDWTGIPTGKMMSNQIYALQKLEQTLAARVIGQEHALKTISQRVKTSRSGIEDPGKPVGVFLLVGTSGVGKTETAIALADIFYGGDRSLITINMSEYQEAHSVSLLRGSPPGYVGYGTGGVLTEAVKRQPYSVLLLDEVEKAHPDVLEVFYQIFDKGVMDDGEGQEVDFKNTIIFLTSNACSELIAKVFEERPDIDIEEINETLRPNLQKYFQPAFLGRLQIIPFKPISPSVLKKISKSKLSVIEQRLLSTYSITLKYRSEVIEGLVRMSMSTDIGARALNQAIDNFITPVISELILESMASKKIISEINILPQLTSDGNFKFEVKYKNLNVALTDL
jgi:type VI secretion system protein VasG